MGIIVIFIVFAIISGIVSSRLKNKFKKYSKIPLKSNLTGAEVAQLMLADHNITDVKVVCIPGQLTDHYNPATKTINLSESVYHGRNAAATAVASHEIGHAVQHATAYSMLEFRSAMVPIQNVSAKVMNFIFIAMLFGGYMFTSFLPWETVGLIIIGCYSIFTLFAFITLPVEFDASNRALAWIKQRGIVDSNEHDMAKDALNSAAMTYVVAAIASLVTLLYYIMMFMGGGDD